MKSDALIKGFFWFVIIVGVLVIAGIYWLLVVALPAAITLLILLIQTRTRKKILETLKPRPALELDTDPANMSFAHYGGNANELVELEKYEQNHQQIAREAQVTKATTLPIDEVIYAFAKGPLSGSAELSDVVLLACVDFVIVGEVRAIETEKIAKEVLGAGGASKVVLNTKFNPDGAVREIKMHPYPVSSGFLGGGQS
jgi:hypothetical protein